MSCLSDGCVAPNGVCAHPIQWVVVGAHVTGVRVHVAPVWKTVTRRSSTFRRTALRGGRLPNWPTRIGTIRPSTRSSSRNGRPRAVRSRSAATCSGRPLPPPPVEKSGAPGPSSPGREAGRRRRNAVRMRNRSWSRRLNGHPRFPSLGASRTCERLTAGTTPTGGRPGRCRHPHRFGGGRLHDVIGPGPDCHETATANRSSDHGPELVEDRRGACGTRR